MNNVLLSILLLVPSTVMSDAGVSVSYRSTPVIVEKNWLNDSKWPQEAAFYDGITTYRTLNMMTINLYFDDSLKAHDKNKVAGKYITKYYISEFEPPSKRHPVGRMVEREVDIGDATPEEIKPPLGANSLSMKSQFMHMMVHHNQVPFMSSIIVGLIVGLSVLISSQFIEKK